MRLNGEKFEEGKELKNLGSNILANGEIKVEFNPQVGGGNDDGWFGFLQGRWGEVMKDFIVNKELSFHESERGGRKIS